MITLAIIIERYREERNEASMLHADRDVWNCISALLTSIAIIDDQGDGIIVAIGWSIAGGEDRDNSTVRRLQYDVIIRGHDEDILRLKPVGRVEREG